jgi:hypothetical protein
MSSPPRDASALPTAEAPEYGAYGSHGIVLSEAKRWIEDDGTRVVRSMEFDVWGEGSNWEDALAEFGESLNALFFHLVELAREGRATEDELEIKSVLTQRLANVIEVHDRELRRRLDWPWRRGRHRASVWQGPSTQENSQLISVG